MNMFGSYLSHQCDQRPDRSKVKKEMFVSLIQFKMGWLQFIVTEKHSGRNVMILCLKSQNREWIGSEAGLCNLTRLVQSDPFNSTRLHVLKGS